MVRFCVPNEFEVAEWFSVDNRRYHQESTGIVNPFKEKALTEDFPENLQPCRCKTL